MNYKEWNNRISNHFFNASAAGRRVALQIDPEELALVAETDDEVGARADFVNAVRARVTKGRRLGLESLDIEFRVNWLSVESARASQPPPIIALLAACVLAGYDMASEPDRGISSGDFYSRLEEILGVDDVPNKARNLFALYWRELNKWLDDVRGGELGASSAFQFGSHSLIGYPLSQCTLRREDRRRLPDFFRWCRLEPGKVVDPHRLYQDFEEWMSLGRCSLTSRAKRLLRELSHARVTDAVEHDLAFEYAHWDGSYRERAGLRSAPIELQCKVIYPHRRVTLQFVPRCPQGFPDGPFDSGNGQPVLVSHGDGGFYEPIPLPVTAARLRHGLKLNRQDFRLVWRGRPLLVLEQDSDLGDWVTQDRASLDEPSVVLCERGQSTAVQDFLGRAAKDGFHSLDSSENGLPPGWVGYCCVELVRSVEPPVGLEDLLPRAGTEMHLDGGLKFANDCWMLGALPTLAIGAESPSSVVVKLDQNVISRPQIPCRIELNEQAQGRRRPTKALPPRRKSASKADWSPLQPRGRRSLRLFDSQLHPNSLYAGP